MGQYSNKFEAKKRQQSLGEAQSVLKYEIEQLQKELESQIVVRSVLEKTMNCQPFIDDPMHKSLSQPAEDLIKEIALLELEILYLEKYLLSLYRKKFAKRLSLSTLFSRVDEKSSDRLISSEVAKTNLLESVNEERSNFVSRSDSFNTLLPTKTCINDVIGSGPLIDSGIFRSHSSLSQHSACSFRASPTFEAVSEALDAYHSLPLSMYERIHDSTSNDIRTEYLVSSHNDRVRETPNWLSEEMIKCLSTIYCHLSDPPLSGHGFGQEAHHIYVSEENSSLDSLTNNPLDLEEASNEYSGMFFTMVEIHGIARYSQKLSSVQELLQSYRSLISKLAQVDPGKLRHEEKLAFWINVHNALVMHAFVVYGIPKGNLKRISLVLKGAYNIGGHTISVETIQSSILRCRLPRPTPWLHSLFFPKTKFKSRDPRKAFAVKHPEPRLRFALCSGCQSDPAVRLYSPKKVFQELEMAKEDYIQMNIKLHKEQRLLVPKNVEYFIKEMGGLSKSGLPEMVEHSLPDSLGNKQGKLWKKVDWVPHNFAFRFQLSNELVR